MLMFPGGSEAGHPPLCPRAYLGIPISHELIQIGLATHQFPRMAKDGLAELFKIMSLFCHSRGHKVRIKALASGLFLKAPQGLLQALFC